MTTVRGYSAKHLRIRIVYAHIKTYRGISIGATHWMGRLKAEDCEAIELTRKLTAQEAERLNEKDGWAMYKAGDETNRFLSQVGVRTEAIRVFGQSFPLAVLLIEGNNWCMDPQHVLIGPPEIQEKLNALVEQAQMIGFWDYVERESTMQEIAGKWDAIIDEIKKG